MASATRIPTRATALSDSLTLRRITDSMLPPDKETPKKLISQAFLERKVCEAHTWSVVPSHSSVTMQACGSAQ